MSHCKKVKLLYVGNECTDSYGCCYSYGKKWTLLRMKICGVYIWKKKYNKISLISQCASLLSDGFSTSFTPWHQSPSRLHCIYVANQVLYLAKGGRRDSCSVSCIVQAVWMWWDLPIAWDSTLEWDRHVLACLEKQSHGEYLCWNSTLRRKVFSFPL